MPVKGVHLREGEHLLLFLKTQDDHFTLLGGLMGAKYVIEDDKLRFSMYAFSPWEPLDETIATVKAVAKTWAGEELTEERRAEVIGIALGDPGIKDYLTGKDYEIGSVAPYRGEIVFRAPKTAKGRRMIALSPSAALFLREHREKQEADRVLLGMPLKDDDLVFSQPNGKPLLPDTVTHAWIKLIRRTRLNGIRLHDARHSHASLMLKQGIHPKIVQERLGHASIQITLDIYSHVTPGL